MKKFKILTVIAIVMAIAALVAFTPSSSDSYSFGYRSTETLVCADTVEVSPDNLTLTYASMAMDTNVVVNVGIDHSLPGDMIVFEFTADASNRQIGWNSNITAVNDSVVATKTKLFQFIYNGTSFVQLSEQQIN